MLQQFRYCFRSNIDHGVWTGLLVCVIFISWGVVDELTASRRRMLLCSVTPRAVVANPTLAEDSEILVRTAVHYGTSLLCAQIVTAVIVTLGLFPFAILRAYFKRYHDVRTSDKRCLLSVRDVTLLKHLECWMCFFSWTAAMMVFAAYEFFPFDTLQALYKDMQLCAVDSGDAPANRQLVFGYESCDATRETPRAGALIAVNAISCFLLYALSVHQILANTRDVAEIDQSRQQEDLVSQKESDTEFD